VAHYNRSSGTTGEAKLVGITHAQRAIRAARETAGFRRRRDDRLLAALPLSNTWARCMALSELANGGAVVFRPATMTFGDLRRMAEAGTITSVALTPPYVRDLLRANGNALMLPGVRVLVASAPLTRAERARTRARITPELFIEYATNETGPLAFATPEDLDEAPDCVGRVVDGVDAEVVDEALRPVPPGSMGELRFRDPMFPSRYAVAASGSTSRFVDGWFYPGDAGTIDSASRITVHGRIDDVINVGGSKVHPAAIESWLTADPRVIEATAIGLPELRQGEAPVAAVVLHEPVAESELMALCRAAGDRLPMPARIVALPELPRNPAGKVDRAALRELLRARLGG
ncbi:MAG: class I adenylate-forming enzyme family protein, partial [Alphaproteobacteria bacterium]